MKSVPSPREPALALASRADVASGTGICHTFINDGERDAVLLAGGEADKASDRIFYELNPERRGDMPWSRWWNDVPPRAQGPHDGRARRR